MGFDEPFLIGCVPSLACVHSSLESAMNWRELLDPEDQREFERMCEGKTVSERFERWFERSEVLQELFEEVMRTDDLGIFITKMLQ